MKISGKSMILYELNKKSEIARQNGFIFNQINKLTMNVSLPLRVVNISYYLKFQIPMCHRQFFRVISQDGEYVEKFCNDMEIPFLFACQKWFSQLN